VKTPRLFLRRPGGALGRRLYQWCGQDRAKITLASSDQRADFFFQLKKIKKKIIAIEDRCDYCGYAVIPQEGAPQRQSLIRSVASALFPLDARPQPPLFLPLDQIPRYLVWFYCARSVSSGFVKTHHKPYPELRVFACTASRRRHAHVLRLVRSSSPGPERRAIFLLPRVRLNHFGASVMGLVSQVVGEKELLTLKWSRAIGLFDIDTLQYLKCQHFYWIARAALGDCSQRTSSRCAASR